jgi:hypothetical protein
MAAVAPGADMRVVLATGPATPDREFAGMAGLARWIVARRAQAPRLTNGVRPPVDVHRAALGRRIELPDGVCLSLRLLDGHHAGRGQLLGYAFIPAPAAGPPPDFHRDLLEAIDLAQIIADRRDERSREEPTRISANAVRHRQERQVA